MTETFAHLTTLRVGGEITDFRRVDDPAVLMQTLSEVWHTGNDWLVLGGGSNLVVGSELFDGTVILIETLGIDIRVDDGETVLVRIQAGENWDDVVAWSVASGLSGIEALSGIPGKVGAAPVQNIGAYGTELSDVLEGIEFFDYVSGELQYLNANELELGYRTSVMKSGLQGVVISVDLRLQPSRFSAPVRYQQLADSIGVVLGAPAELAEVREHVLALRRSKGMVLDENDPDSVSAGSFFTNPIVSGEFARTLPSDVPRWPVEPITSQLDTVVPLADLPEDFVSHRVQPEIEETQVKLSAAWLIQHSGIRPGFAFPGSQAQVSQKHTLALINRGQATGEEIVDLARFIQTRVMAEFGVLLWPEPRFLGVQL